MSHIGAIFPVISEEVPDLDTFLKEENVPEQFRFLVARVLNTKTDEDNHRIQAWPSFVEDKFKFVYQVSVDLVNGWT